MRHSVHLFIGEEMVSIAETISNHLQRHSSNTASHFFHVACWENIDGIRTFRILGNDGFKVSMEDDEQGKYYLADLHDRIITIALQDDFGDELYVCVYVQLYDDSVMDEVLKFISWSKGSKKTFLIDVYGLANDVAKVFCTSKAEEHDLIRKGENLHNTCKSNCHKIISLKDSNDLNRFLLLQNCNLNGIGLAMDKNTLIRILSEFALLTTEQFNDIFPQVDFSRPDVTAFGIAALWFDKYFFTDYLLSYTYLFVLDRENVGQHTMDNPLDLLIRARKYVSENTNLLSTFHENYIKPKAIIGIDTSSFKTGTCNEFKRRLDELRNVFVSIISDNTLSLPEKRAMLALFIREDDELFDDNVLLEELPTVDDCFTESLKLYVDEENYYESEGNSPIISGPRNEDGKLYLPLDALKQSKTEIRRSQSFIRRCEKRLKEIKEVQQITENSKRRLTPEGFTYGETTYHLQHDIVEKPLAETYIPSNNKKRSVDLRSSFSPIRNQGKIGSCTAFSTISVFEYVLNQAQKGKKHILSPRYLYYNVCKKNIDGTPVDNGSSLYDNFESLGRDGVCVETLCPYDDDFKIPPTDEAKQDALSHLVTEAKNVNICHKDLTSALADGHPIAVSLKLFNSFGAGENGFIFRPTPKELESSDFGWHAMVICGYSEEKKIYIVRNSWGVGFGDHGYCYIPFSYIEDRSLCRQASIITGISCEDVSSPVVIDEVIHFDEESYTIEYAITRILKEEEEQVLIGLESKYNKLNGEYIQLVRELTNLGKRDKLTEHAVNRIEVTPIEKAGSDTHISIQNKSRFGNEKWMVLAILLVFSFFTYTISPILCFILVIVAVVLFIWMLRLTKREIIKEISHPTPSESIVADLKLSQKMKFICAGQAIDIMSDFRNELEKKHRYLASYIGHLSIWRNAEQKYFNEFDDNLKPPFNTILSIKDFKQVFSLKKDVFIGDLLLWKEFRDYEPTEKIAREFQIRLKEKLRERIKSLYSNFSMCKFIMKPEEFDYLYSTQEWHNKLEQQSTPFVQSMGINPSTRKVLFVKVQNQDEQELWEQHIATNYCSNPICAYGGPLFKLTYIQTQSLKKDDVRFLQQ